MSTSSDSDNWQNLENIPPISTREPGCHFILGFIANERWLSQQAVDRKLCEPEDLEQDRKATISTVAQDVIKRSGIRGLRLDSIWVGNCTTSLCWVLPSRYRKSRHRSERRLQELETLRQILRSPDSGGRVGAFLLEEEPMFWAWSEHGIPQTLMTSDFFVKRIALYRWEDFTPTKVQSSA